MEKLLDIISSKITKAFSEAGYDTKYGKATLSNRPDLCQFQCNGAMAAAKEYKTAPANIAANVLTYLKDDKTFAKIEVVNPGFLNIDLNDVVRVKYWTNDKIVLTVKNNR